MKPTHFVLPLLAASLVSSASAATVLVDFSSAGGSAAGADTNGNFWTTIATTGATSNLIDTTNTASGINLTLTFSGGAGIGFGGSAFNNGDVSAPAPFNQAFAFGDGLFANDAGANFATISLSGLTANTNYSITLYGGRNSGWSTGSALIGVTDGTGTGGTYGNRSPLTFTITSTASGTAAFTFREQGGAGTVDSVTLTSFSLTSVPEPSVALLGGLGVLGLLRRRRSA